MKPLRQLDTDVLISVHASPCVIGLINLHPFHDIYDLLKVRRVVGFVNRFIKPIPRVVDDQPALRMFTNLNPEEL
jgi:hypothetical protein